MQLHMTYECDHSYLRQDALDLREVLIPTLCSSLIACSILIDALVVIADILFGSCLAQNFPFSEKDPGYKVEIPLFLSKVGCFKDKC